jgi:hypothetical protein
MSYNYKHTYCVHWIPASLYRIGRNYITIDAVNVKEIQTQRHVMIEWCELHLVKGEEWSEGNNNAFFKGTQIEDVVYIPTAFYFKNSEDALAFKLRFGI